MFWRVFIFSPVDGHHGGFHFGAIMNVVGINTCVRFLSRQMFSFRLCKYLGVEFLGQIATPLKCLRNCHSSQSGCTSFHHPHPNSVQKLQCFHILPQSCYCLFLKLERCCFVRWGIELWFSFVVP